jgi:urease accessory protein
MENLVRIGIGGPVGSGKSHLLLRLCEGLRDRRSIIAITNDIYTREDAQFLTRHGALEPGRIVGVETGGCPHAAIRDDITLNLGTLRILSARFPDAELAFIESGGDNLSATFSPDLADYQIYVIDVAQGDDIPRKGGMGIARSDLLVVNKIDLAPYVEVNLEDVRRDVEAARGPLPYAFTNLKTGAGMESVLAFVTALIRPAAGGAPPLWSDPPTLTSGRVHDHHHDSDHGGHHNHTHPAR